MKPKVLVVEDDPEFAQLLRFNLQLDGFESLVVPDGFHALHLALTELPDVILLDLMLPDLDGLVVCEKLNSQPSTRDIPIFIVSALNESWTKTRRSNARFTRFFTKPVDLKVLRESVRTAAGERQALRRPRWAAAESTGT
jgi:DNA-binding response OmpR family regulator